MPSEECKEFSSSTVVREDFLQKVALDMVMEEWWKFWGMAFQAEGQQKRLNLVPHIYTAYWSLIFYFQGPSVFIFITYY